MSVVVETARPDEAAACARLLADVLGDDPVIRAMIPGDRDRTARLVALHVAQLRSGPLPGGSVPGTSGTGRDARTGTWRRSP